MVILKMLDYPTKLDASIDDDIMRSTYVETTDKNLKELSQFQNFLYRIIYNYDRYKNMKPNSKQPARLSGTATIQKFENLGDITAASLKF